jgi:hypothetical protein
MRAPRFAAWTALTVPDRHQGGAGNDRHNERCCRSNGKDTASSARPGKESLDPTPGMMPARHTFDEVQQFVRSRRTTTGRGPAKPALQLLNLTFVHLKPHLSRPANSPRSARSA